MYHILRTSLQNLVRVTDVCALRGITGQVDVGCCPRTNNSVCFIQVTKDGYLADAEGTLQEWKRSVTSPKKSVSSTYKLCSGLLLFLNQKLKYSVLTYIN